MPDITFKEDEYTVETRENVGLEHIPRIGDKLTIEYLVEGIDQKVVIGKSYNVLVRIKRLGAIKNV